MTKKRQKGIYIGAPACFRLEQACQIINDAFGKNFGCYLVGSALLRADWRDVDVRYIMVDKKFHELFPDASNNWEFDPRWLLLTVSISKWLADYTGLPIDFQIQPQTHANSQHKGLRNALGLRMVPPGESVAGKGRTSEVTQDELDDCYQRGKRP